ncbi:L-2-hydroxyglutarate oxidase [Nesterenkonia natronophila]|uniref:L-2-hydroxyglutarate oxidase n=1 Tax=Nesterenkonia natronophila TaxID=2174932 RepID=A0A3A4F3H4_9MICC|nr:L-2-hydroxyglutarate oxidase [Nesterenkonia natronophila]RJN32892.1 L-2-hydroxyglutarate oxidase [Nesterenkonia natronophila]
MSLGRVAVIGGGIIGLAVARELLDRRPGSEVVVYEKEDRVAAHQTGRNSGVVHAGLYYTPGGLKARLCRRGVGLLQEFARTHGVSYQECGKIVVAKDQVELERLKNIYHRATANGVPGIRMIGPDEISEVEPAAVGLAALHSPTTAIADFAGVAEALSREITASGGEVRLSTEVRSISEGAASSASSARGAVRVSAESAGTKGGSPKIDHFDLVITCAGTQSDRLARGSGEDAFPKIVPFYGDYFMLSEQKAAQVNGLIYPVPDPQYPFLGVHITRRYDGEVMLGPNAFLALGREHYSRLGLNPRDVLEVVSSPGFWKFASKNIPAAIRETRTAMSKRVFVGEANKYMPGIALSDVTRGSRGIRAQAMNADGSLVDDFVITGSARLVHVRNAPSPAATSALAIAEHIVSQALREEHTV